MPKNANTNASYHKAPAEGKDHPSVIETVVEREIMPAGAPWSKKSSESDVTDPPVPNRAHTEMKKK